MAITVNYLLNIWPKNEAQRNAARYAVVTSEMLWELGIDPKGRAG